MLPRTSGLEIFRKMRAGEMAQAGRVIVVTTSMCNAPQRATLLHVLKGSAVLRAKIDMSSPNVIMLKSQKTQSF